MFVLFLFSKLPRPWELRILKHNNPLLCCIYYTPPATVLWWRYSPRVTHLKHSRHASSQYIYWASVMVYLVSTLGKWLFTTQAVLRFTRRINRKWGIKISGVHELSTSGTEKELPTAVGSHASCSPGNTHINDKKQWEGVYRGSVHGWWERPKWKETLVMNQWELGDEQEGGCLPQGQGRGHYHLECYVCLPLFMVMSQRMVTLVRPCYCPYAGWQGLLFSSPRSLCQDLLHHLLCSDGVPRLCHGNQATRARCCQILKLSAMA